MAVLLHYFFLSAFCWMLCEGVMLYLLLVVVFSQLTRKWWFFLLLGYGEFCKFQCFDSGWRVTNILESVLHGNYQAINVHLKQISFSNKRKVSYK